MNTPYTSYMHTYLCQDEGDIRHEQIDAHFQHDVAAQIDPPQQQRRYTGHNVSDGARPDQDDDKGHQTDPKCLQSIIKQLRRCRQDSSVLKASQHEAMLCYMCWCKVTQSLQQIMMAHDRTRMMTNVTRPI